MFGLGCQELLLLAIFLALPLMIALRVLKRNRQEAEKPPEDDSGW
jgi:hypothetical protein